MRTLLIFLLICSLSGCGTRKRAVHVESIKKDVRLVQENNITTNSVIEKTEKTIEYSPLDPEKPMVLPDGRTVINSKVTESTIDTKEDRNVVDLSKKDEASRSETSKKDTGVETKKANPYLWIYIAIGTVVALYLTYLFLRKR